MNREFKLVVPTVYQDRYEFADGRASGPRGGKNGLVDKTGKVIISLQYRVALGFSEGLAAVPDDNNVYGYIDVSGALVIPHHFYPAGDFHDGIAAVVDAETHKSLHR